MKIRTFRATVLIRIAGCVPATITTTIRLLLTPSVPRFTHLQKTFEKARRKPYFQGDGLNQNSWLRSGNRNNANNAYYLNTSGVNSNSNTDNVYSVRPALHSLTKEVCKIFPVFYSVMRNRTDQSYEMKGTAVLPEPYFSAKAKPTQP